MSLLGQTLVKLAISGGRLRIPQTRTGRRPMSVDTLLRKEREGTLYKAAEDQIAGGKADNKSPSDFNPEQLAKGVKIEREHTNSSALAQEIAMDHLEEFPDYYSALEKMEKGLEAKKEAEAGPWESQLPWYTTALGASTGGLAAAHYLPEKYRAAGTVAGSLLGTAAGLGPGTALGRAIDRRHASAPMRPNDPAGVGIEHEVNPGLRTLDLANKVAALGGQLGARSITPNKYPDRTDSPERDPMSVRGLDGTGINEARASSLSAGYTPIKIAETTTPVRPVSAGEAARGAAVGAVMAPVMANLGRLVSGSKRPGASLARQTAAEMLSGGFFGGALPFAKNRMESSFQNVKSRRAAKKSQG